MEAVFLGGSRRVSRLDERIRAKLDELIDRGLWIFVGDANGADRAMQQHLADRAYENVVVYAIAGRLRNNVGQWKVCSVDAPHGARGFDLYSAKDIEMAKDASYGLMLWDGKSRGTLANVRNLLAHGKPVAVYVGPERRLVNLRSPADLTKLDVPPNVDTATQHEFSFKAGVDVVRETGPTEDSVPPQVRTVQPKETGAPGDARS